MTKPLAVFSWSPTKEYNSNRTLRFFLRYSVCPQKENARMAVEFPANLSRALITSAPKDPDYHHSPKVLLRNTTYSITKTRNSSHPFPNSPSMKE